MELKLQCDCGQKYAFDVEPLNGQMPFTVNCPSCGVDGTPTANTTLAEMAAATTPAAAPTGLRINATPAPIRVATPPAFILPSAAATPPPLNTPRPLTAQPVKAKKPDNANFGMGILGAVIGAVIGAGLVYGLYYFTGFRIPYTGLAIGAATGYGARILYKGTDNGLAVVAMSIAFLAVVGTLYLIYGFFPFIFLISVGVSGYVAYRIVSD